MRFFFTFVCFVFLAFLAWSIIVFAQSGNPTRMSQWVHDVYEKKQAAAREIGAGKIVLVAGSNALFGIDSRALAEAFAMPVINYGVNAGIELPCTLKLARQVVRAGDLVIMPLEYPMYSYDGTPGVQMIDYILSRDPGFFRDLSLREQVYILTHVTFKRVLRGYLYQGGEKITQGVYGAHNVDPSGDQLYTALKYRRPEMAEQVKQHQLNPETYSRTFDPDAIGWQYLDAFVRYCGGLNVPVIFMPSTLMVHDSYFNDPGERWFYENIPDQVRKRGWTYIGHPYDYMYGPDLYFNTNFHLVEKGRTLRTRQMIADLKPHMIE